VEDSKRISDYKTTFEVAKKTILEKFQDKEPCGLYFLDPARNLNTYLPN